MLSRDNVVYKNLMQLLKHDNSKAISLITMDQKEELMVKVMKMHFTFCRCKGELDQLCSGLDTMGVTDALEHHQDFLYQRSFRDRQNPSL